MKFDVTYTIISGIYHVELTGAGSWFGGGNTGCSSYDEAYMFASKLAQSKGGRVERFRLA